MSTHSIEPDKSWRRSVPFGVGRVKPKHFRDMAKVVWKNKDNLGYAWKILSQGVCDGCALGVAGLHDWTVTGPHLCMTRLNLLRLNTMPELDHTVLDDVSRLEKLSNAELRELGRLPYPMLRKRGERGFSRISWDKALELVGTRIREFDPKRIAFFVTSRGVTNEIYYMAQKSARYLGTNNVDNAARLCHSPSSAAMKQTLGVAASTCSYKDWYGSDLIIFFGSNPANDQPVSIKYLHEAKKLGSKVVLVNPYLEPGMKEYWVPSNLDSAVLGTNVSDYWFPVSQGGDIAFLYGVIRILLERDWVNKEFIAEHVTGMEELRKRCSEWSWEDLEKRAGLKKSSFEEFAELIHNAKTGIVIWSMGITQHPWGGDGVQMVLNLALTQGWLGRERCGVMPIRGHSSVQGGAEMGAYATALPGAIPITPENCKALGKHYGFEIPQWRGFTTTEMVEASASGDLDVLYCVGGNFLRTLPDPDYVKTAMSRPKLRVHQDIILTDQMFIEGDEVLLLPAQTRYEQEDGGTETSTERRVMFTPQIHRQVGEARAEWRILRDVALAAKPDAAGIFGCNTGHAMRKEIAQVVPFYDGVQHLKKTGDAFQYGGPHLCPNGKCATTDGKAHISAPDLPPERTPGHFHVSTRRGKQFNTLIYAEVDPLTGADRDAVFMSPEDAGKLHLRQGDRVALVNDLGRMEGHVLFAAIAPGNLQVHWPEGNILIDRHRKDAKGGVPDYNAEVRVETAGCNGAHA